MILNPAARTTLSISLCAHSCTYVTRSIPEIGLLTHSVFGPRCKPAKKSPRPLRTDLKPDRVLSVSFSRMWRRLNDDHRPSKLPSANSRCRISIFCTSARGTRFFVNSTKRSETSIAVTLYPRRENLSASMPGPQPQSSIFDPGGNRSMNCCRSSSINSWGIFGQLSTHPNAAGHTQHCHGSPHTGLGEAQPEALREVTRHPDHDAVVSKVLDRAQNCNS